MKRKAAYLDWAGDAGLKQTAGSSAKLVVAVAVAIDGDVIGQLSKALRSRLGLPERYEFHFARTPQDIRSKYFEAIVHWPFEAAAIVADKERLAKQPQVRSGSRLLAEMAAELAARFPPERLEGVQLIVDAPDDRHPDVMKIGLAVRQTLRAAGLKKGIVLKGRPAHIESGLQLADMLAGAVMQLETGGEDYVARLQEKLRVWRK